MQKELERAGIPTALITSLPLVATSVGATRVVQGSGIAHPLGNPTLSPEREQAWRRAIVAAAVRALASPVTEPQVFVAGG